MASIYRKGNRAEINVTVGGVRKTVRLGECSESQAGEAKRHIEHLNSARRTGSRVSDETVAWHGTLDQSVQSRIARAGLSGRIGSRTLGPWAEDCMQERRVARNTEMRLRQSLRVACDFFGRDRALTGIARRDVMGYATFLSGKYSGSTARKKLADFKSWMRLAHERRHTPSDPAAGVFIDADPSTKTYLIRSGDYCKIGKAVNVRKRLAELQCGNPLPLDLIHAHGHDCEKELHERFAPMREKGEWFRIEGDLANYLRAFTHRRAAISAAH